MMSRVFSCFWLFFKKMPRLRLSSTEEVREECDDCLVGSPSICLDVFYEVRANCRERRSNGYHDRVVVVVVKYQGYLCYHGGITQNQDRGGEGGALIVNWSRATFALNGIHRRRFNKTILN